MNVNAASASAMQQGQIGQQVAMAVAGKQMDAARQQGQAMVSLLQQAADLQQDVAEYAPHKGNHIDVKA